MSAMVLQFEPVAEPLRQVVPPALARVWQMQSTRGLANGPRRKAEEAGRLLVSGRPSPIGAKSVSSYEHSQSLGADLSIVG